MQTIFDEILANHAAATIARLDALLHAAPVAVAEAAIEHVTGVDSQAEAV